MYYISVQRFIRPKLRFIFTVYSFKLTSPIVSRNNTLKDANQEAPYV